MESNLYVDALFRDPYLAAMIQVLLEDGLIDRTKAEIMWLAVVALGTCVERRQLSPRELTVSLHSSMGLCIHVGFFGFFTSLDCTQVLKCIPVEFSQIRAHLCNGLSETCHLVVRLPMALDTVFKKRLPRSAL